MTLKRRNAMQHDAKGEKVAQNEWAERTENVEERNAAVTEAATCIVTPSSCPRDLPVTATLRHARTTRACDGRVTELRLLRFRDASVPHVSLHAIIPKRVATIHQGTACDEGRTATVQLQDLRRRNCGRETDRA